MKKQKKVVWYVDIFGKSIPKGKSVPKQSLGAAERDAAFYKAQGLIVKAIRKVLE